MLVTAGLALAAYGGLRTLRPPSPDADIRLFDVVRRDFPVVLQEKGELNAANSIRISCELEGRATIIELVAEGTHVKKGDLLVQLASDQIEEQIREAETREATADAAYEAAVKELQILKDEDASKIRKGELAVWLAENQNEKYNKGDAAELRQDSNLALERAKYVLRRSEEELKDSEELYEQGFITRIELENDKFDKYTAEIELKKATLAL
ncbi:MAG: hypothetical protein JXA69_14225, partial [Phycisphaerae bacterium]|nr:hypothetical protein [Phycisphaerae bacterium]